MPNYSIVVPIYNEIENIPDLYRRISETMNKLDMSYELIFVNDGSSDGSLELLKSIQSSDHKVKIISFSRNFGQEAAFETGFKHTKGSYVIQLDADMQNPPEEIKKLIDKSSEGFDIVYGIRKKRRDSLFRVLASKIFHWVVKTLFHIKIPKEISTFRIIRGDIARQISNLPEKTKFFVALAAWVGAKSTHVETEHFERKLGKSKWNAIKLTIHSIDLIVGHSVVPLRIISIMGITFSFVGFGLGIYMFVMKFFYSMGVSGFAAIIVSTTLLSGVQLLSLGVIGEYLARIYVESQGRPECIIKERIGFNE